MPKLSPTVLSIGLLGAGVAVWALATPPLIARADAKVPLNPLGINTSSYGEVFAMAMQSPIDAYWHGAEDHHHAHDEHCNHEHEEEHVHDEHCDHDHEEESAAEKIAQTAPAASMQNHFRDFLSALSKVPDQRTNAKPASAALKRHLRREAEDKLRFAYQLDPAHYANYNSLHFFLTEPSIGTRPELTPSAAKLAQDTVDYCLKQDHDPRPALTAAAACTNILHLMFADRHAESPKYTTQQMRQCLGLLDHCIARYVMIAKQWDESKNWELLSPMRITECEDRFSFITKIREAAEKTIIRLENESPNQQVAN
jgi:hypothetical protein